MDQRTLLTSVHLMGLVAMPCRSIRNRKNGKDTAFEKKTRPMKAGMFANA